MQMGRSSVQNLTTTMGAAHPTRREMEIQMTNINLDLAKTLDGSQTHMIAILVDSWGDKLVVNLNCETHNWAADYFMPCAHCGNAVLVCNFESDSDCCDRCTYGHKSGFVPTTSSMLDGLLRVHTLPEDENLSERVIRIMDKCTAYDDSRCGICDIYDLCTMRSDGTYNCKKETTMEKQHVVDATDQKLELGERIAIATDRALEAFWEEVVKVFPESNDGAFLMSDMDDIAQTWVKHWVELNVPEPMPEPTFRGNTGELNGLHLHYQDIWHMLHTGVGCMVASTDNMLIGDKYHYLAVTSDCVCIYEDRFDDSFLQEHIVSWTYGDNPTVLMNYIDEFMGGNRFCDSGKLFDDIMTIGKSNLV